MKSIAIVHYQPLEFYPPIINLLNLAGKRKNVVFHVFTTENNKRRKPYVNDPIKIHRYQLPGSEFIFMRFIKYFFFNLGTLFNLIRIRPAKIFYFETYSAYPVYLYKKYFNKKVIIYIHCHEYYSPDWYETFMRLMRFYHKKETAYLYPNAKWISHTNEDRINFFKQDHPFLSEWQFHVLPNYPPASWKVSPKTTNISARIIQCVYIGSLSIETTYIREFCEWLQRQNGQVHFDIYSYNIPESTKNYLRNIETTYIKFYEDGVEYENIPGILANYDVGLLLYKANTLNVKYCAPNKLFEYLTCGLDVWFSEEMLGCYNYVCPGSYPKVIKVDFKSLDKFDYITAVKNEELSKAKHQFCCDDVLNPLLDELCAS